MKNAAFVVLGAIVAVSFFAFGWGPSLQNALAEETIETLVSADATAGGISAAAAEHLGVTAEQADEMVAFGYNISKQSVWRYLRSVAAADQCGYNTVETRIVLAAGATWRKELDLIVDQGGKFFIQDYDVCHEFLASAK